MTLNLGDLFTKSQDKLLIAKGF